VARESVGVVEYILFNFFESSAWYCYKSWLSDQTSFTTNSTKVSLPTFRTLPKHQDLQYTLPYPINYLRRSHKMKLNLGIAFVVVASLIQVTVGRHCKSNCLACWKNSQRSTGIDVRFICSNEHCRDDKCPSGYGAPHCAKNGRCVCPKTQGAVCPLYDKNLCGCGEDHNDIEYFCKTCT